MNDPLRADLFVEDHAQESFVAALVRRIAKETRIRLEMQVRASRGGAPRVLDEFRMYQRAVGRRTFWSDVVVVVLDGNCSTSRKKRGEIEAMTERTLRDRLVAGSPDPHIERWFLADPASFHRVVGYQPTVGPEKCERAHYKKLLTDAIQRGQHAGPLGGSEYAGDLVGAMDLFRAGKNDPSLGDFVRDLRARLRTVR